MSVTPLHYSASAVPDLRGFAVRCAEEGWPVTAHMVRELATGLDSAVKFILPDGGRMFNGNSWRQSEMDALRLPYPIIAAEYYSPQTPGTGVAVSRRIALAMDIEVCAKRLGLPEAGAEGLVLVWPISRVDGANQWVPYMYGVLVRCGDPVMAFDPQVAMDYPGAHHESDMIPVRTVPMPEMVQRFRPSVPEIAQDTGDELRAITELCAVLNCSNIETRTISPRRKQGRGKNKRKLYEYRTLEVAPSSGRQSEPGQPSDRRAPRIHLRRGHIRRLGEERTTWVQPCMVGSKHAGMVVKDYAVRAGS